MTKPGRPARRVPDLEDAIRNLEAVKRTVEERLAAAITMAERVDAERHLKGIEATLALRRADLQTLLKRRG